MSARTVAAATVLVMVGAVGACAPPTSSDDGGGTGASLPGADLSDVEVDTTTLAKQRKAAGIADCPTVAEGVEPVDQGLPDLTLPCLGGTSTVNLAAIRGKPTVLNFWASWCKPCQDELPTVQRLHESGKVRVLGVDFQDPQPGTALDLAADSGVTYPSVADPTRETKTPLEVAVVPQTVFVRADGTIAATERVVYRDYGELAEDVREHLGVRL